MKNVLRTSLLLICSCTCGLLYGWGSGHDDHVRLVLDHLPKAIVNQWTPQQIKKMTLLWSHYPDGHKVPHQDPALKGILTQQDFDFLKEAGISTQYRFHTPCGKALAFYLLAKSFRDKKMDAAALYAGALLHVIADASAFNHGPLVHHYTYTKYKHIPYCPFMNCLDLCYMRRSRELTAMIQERLRGFMPTDDDITLEDLLLKTMQEIDDGVYFASTREHRILMPPPASLTAMTDVAELQTHQGSYYLLKAWTLAHSQKPLNLTPKYFAPNGYLDKTFAQWKKKQPPRDPSKEGIYDGLFVPTTYPAIGIVCEGSSTVLGGRLGFGARFLSAITARSLRNAGKSIAMISVDDLKTLRINPKQMPVLIYCSRSAGPAWAVATIREYLRQGGKLIWIGGRTDAGLTGMGKHFVKRQNREIPVTSTYGKANEDVYQNMAVIRMSDGKSFKLKDNPNCPAGNNKPFSDISISQAKGITSLYELDNGKDRFCVAATTGRTAWLPQYLLMPFLFSDDTVMKDWAHPVLDSFGKEVILTTLSHLD